MTSDTGSAEPNVEAGDYIEDDPEAWVAWVQVLRRYGPEFGKLTAHLGSEDAAAEVLAGTMLSVLADQHGLYLRRAIEDESWNAALVAVEEAVGVAIDECPSVGWAESYTTDLRPVDVTTAIAAAIAALRKPEPHR